MVINKLVFKIFKILIIIISVGYIVFKLYTEWQQGLLFINLNAFSIIDSLWFLLAVLLVIVNWGLESLKFKELIKPLQNLTFYQSIQAVFAGITVSIFTPKRIGEFGGRIFVLHTNNRLNGIFATLLGNFSQLLITLIIGIIFFPLYSSMNINVSEFITNKALVTSIVYSAIILLLVAYLYISTAVNIMGRIKSFKKYNNFSVFLQKYSTYKLLNILLLSFLRYVVFSLQFFLLLKVFGLDITCLDAIIGISQVYFFMTIMPTFALGELGVRGSISVWVFSTFATFTSAILMASILLWILNLALPALVGTYYLSKLKY